MIGRSRRIAGWLLAVALLVAALVVVGGATRLTGSGLSITQWEPILGALPPMSGAAWARAFGLYRATSQYQLLNRGMALADFKVLFWWEWAHRLLARGVGVAFAAPFVVLLATRRLPGRLIWPCTALLALGGVQGLVGWWMVKSGLEGRVAVAPERLAIHLGLALLLFSGLIWTALGAWAGSARPVAARRGGWPLACGALAAGVYFQCLLGALVAGNSGGLIDNDWPLMAGRLIPSDYWQGSPWATVVHGPPAAQLHHRLLAYGLVLFATGLAIAAVRSRQAPAALRRLAVASAGVTLVQVALGVLTLLWGVPLWLALLHQANATLLLGVAVALAWRSRRMERYYNT